MNKKEINNIKNNMGEIEFYKYFYYNGDDEFMEEYIEQFREQEKILQLIYKSIKDDKNYKINLYEGSISIENKKTKDCYKISIEF